MNTSKMLGYAGKVLFVNLTTSTIDEKPLDPELAINFIGGYGIGAKVLFDKMLSGIDPLGPENIIGFIPGLANGTNAAMGGRYMVVCKSPVTKGWNDANSGGYFGLELKKAGYDAVFISGASKKPVYLWLNDGKAEIRDAGSLWGLNTKSTQKALEIETGEERVKAAVIGPSGENLSLISGVVNDGHRVAARGGLGAVMGSKKLKAVAVRGTGKIQVADRKKLKELNEAVRARIKNPPEGDPTAGYVKTFRETGTAGTMAPSALSGDAPVKNWGGVGIRDYGPESTDKINVDNYESKYYVKKYSCASCPLRCGTVYKADKAKWPIPETERPEYETLAAFGTNCCVDDIEAIFKCNEICNITGLDTISAGSVVAWVFECYEKGLLTSDQLDGIEAEWGNADAMVKLTEKMGSSEGCGRILAMGQRGACDHWGVGEDLLTVASGIELGMHDPRLSQGFARIYQYDPTPGRHVKGGAATMPADAPNRGAMDVGYMAFFEVLSAAGFCQFAMFSFPEGVLYQMIEAITGQKFDEKTGYVTGLRIMNMRHAFNMREGLRRKDFDISPRAVGKPVLEEGPTAGITVDHEKMGDDFFHTIGWDLETGLPKKKALQGLGGLEKAIESLYPEK